jgi:co-chaperonin GroES (HSP10)
VLIFLAERLERKIGASYLWAAGGGRPPRQREIFYQEEVMKFRPLHDRVVVKRIEAEEKTRGGIIIPDTAKEKPQEGEVIAVGPGARDDSGKLIALELRAGDRSCSANGRARRSRSMAKTS